MSSTIKTHLETAERLIENGCMEQAQAHSLQAIARLMVQVLTWADQAMLLLSSANLPGETVELVAEPCQCECGKRCADDLAEAAPELLRLVREAMPEQGGRCPWCSEYFPRHYFSCPAAAILKRFDGR